MLAGYAVLTLAARPRSAQAVAALTIAVAGWSRLLSPLTYEAHRGLQIEPVWATPAMLGWGFGPARWLVHFSSYKALEVADFGVPALLTASTVSEIALAATLVVHWGRLLRRPGAATPVQVAWVSLAGVTGFVVTGKVLSPQHLLWLLAIVVAGLAVSYGARAFRSWAAVLLVVVALMHGFIPEAYQARPPQQPHVVRRVGAGHPQRAAALAPRLQRRACLAGHGRGPGDGRWRARSHRRAGLVDGRRVNVVSAAGRHVEAGVTGAAPRWRSPGIWASSAWESVLPPAAEPSFAAAYRFFGHKVRIALTLPQ